MQKKLIALAVAALASGAAFAQSNVQIYGSIDVGFSHRGDSFGGSKSQNAIDSGLSAGNRLGFTGTEDLGNGVKALFQIEAGYLADTGNHDQQGQLFGRQAFVGLTGDFGTAIAGRLYTPHYSFVSAVDPFKAGTVGRYNNTYGSDLSNLGVVAPGARDVVATVLDPVRVDNAVAYVSPSWSGFNFTAAYSTNAIGQDNLGNRHSQNTVVALLPRYTNGPLDIAFNYHRIKAADGLSITGDAVGEVDDVTNLLIGGTYDFNVVKLAALYSKNKVDFNSALSALKVDSWLLGATIPFGKHAVLVSYNHSKAKLGDLGLNDKAKQWALGYTYAFSKRTNVYAAYSDISNDNFRYAVTGDASNYNFDYQNGFQFGLKHTF